jgi:glycosyltransferase involved in cell wall biosynthesis
MRISFTTNLCAHYNVGTFEALSRYFDVDYFFYSAGEEWYWQERHGVRAGNFHFEYLHGFHLGRTRITLTLPVKLWRGNYDCFIKCINGRFALPVTFLIAKLKHKPFILWTGIWTRIQTSAHRLFFPITRYIYTHSDAIVVYGSHTKEYLISEGVSPAKIFIATHVVKNEIYNRVVPDEEKNVLRYRLNIEPNQKVVLYLGRLEEIKGLPYLFRAFQQATLNDAALIIGGDGSLRPSLELLARELNIIDRIRFAGYVSPEESPAYYSLASVFVLPSVTVPSGKELWGLVVNEAFNQGVPVIASDAVGAAAGGLVQDGVNGFIFQEKDVQALSLALKRLLTENELQMKLSQNARLTIASWDYERNVAGYRQAIEYVTKNGEIQ